MSNDYKETLNLPKTDFPMKANLTQREPETLNFIEENRIYQKIQEQNKNKTSYILHDGPPYANGHIHIGHALNKILKDIIVKYYSMKGFYSPYVPGWDCHGLPIELHVDKELGSRKHEIDILEKRNLCREYALKYINIQKEEFIRLGVIGDWQKPYLTMTYDYEASIIREFFTFLERGYVYKSKKPVHWCPSCVTALAEAEVEYGEKKSPSIYVRFKVKKEDVERIIPDAPHSNIFIIIWTTTPWTLPANLALAIHPDIEYSVVKTKDGRSDPSLRPASGDQKTEIYYIVADTLLERLGHEIGLEGDVIKRIKGSDLAGIRTIHPFIDRESSVMVGDFVTVENGTGVVHIAPGHGMDDYEIGLRYGLDIYAPVDGRGKFTHEAGELAGKPVFVANESVIEILKSKNALLKNTEISHSYPHCWRCKKPVIFRATEQWFISMKNDNLRDKCLDEIEKVEWIPSWGKERIHGMLKNRPDWCISRQRSWGIPIAIIRCSDCGELIIDRAILDRIISRFEKKGADIWFELKTSDFLSKGYRCKKCNSADFTKEVDILDVWFDSGVSHAAVLEGSLILKWPADLYLEGSDQHRGWFQSSLIASTATRGQSPFKKVLTHGFVVDGQGKKMSKSIGNVIAPQDIIKRNGAEILRLWVSSEDYRNDVRISNEIIQRLTEAYRKIRNTCRFLLGNINDLDDNDYSDSLLEIDLWAMSRLQNLIKNVTGSYEAFTFHDVYHNLYNFCIVDMSSFYLDILKDRLYTFKRDSVERRAAQWTMKKILTAMAGLMAPILSFIAEEIWQYMKTESRGRKVPLGQRPFTGQKSEDAESIFLSEFPVVNNNYLDEKLENKWNELKKIRDVVNKALELKRKDKFIGNSLEARVLIFADDTHYELLNEYRGFLPTLFIVSQASLKSSEEFTRLSEEEKNAVYEDEELKGIHVIVAKAEGEKCERCWNFSTKVGTFSDEPSVCERCYEALN